MKWLGKVGMGLPFLTSASGIHFYINIKYICINGNNSHNELLNEQNIQVNIKVYTTLHNADAISLLIYTQKSIPVISDEKNNNENRK